MPDVIIPTADDVSGSTPDGALVPLITGTDEIKAQAWSEMVAELLAAVRAGANVTIDRTTDGQITIAASGGGGSAEQVSPQEINPLTTVTLDVGTLGSPVGATDADTIQLLATEDGDIITNVETGGHTFDIAAGSYMVFVKLTNLATADSGSDALANRATVSINIDGLPSDAVLNRVPHYFRGALRSAAEEGLAQAQLYLPNAATGVHLELHAFPNIGGNFNEGWEARVSAILFVPLGGVRGEPGAPGGGSASRQATIDLLTGDAGGDVNFTREGSGDSSNLRGALRNGVVTLAKLSAAVQTILGRVPGVPPNGAAGHHKVWKTDGSGAPGWRDDAAGSGGASTHFLIPSSAQAVSTTYPNIFAANVNVNTILAGVTSPEAGDIAAFVKASSSSAGSAFIEAYNGTRWVLLNEEFGALSTLNAEGAPAADASGRWRETWDADEVYLRGDIVSHTDPAFGAANYIARVDNTGIAPPAGGTWHQLSTTITHGNGAPPEGATPATHLVIAQGGIAQTIEIVDHQARADIASNAAAPTVPEWVSGNAYAAGALASYHGRVWRAVTALAASITAPSSSTHWHPVGAFAGTWSSDKSYALGNWVIYGSQFYVASVNIPANTFQPGYNTNWLHLAPDLHGFRGVWAAGTEYVRGDLVWQSDHFYRCSVESVTSNTGPVTDTDSWDPVGIYHDEWADNRRYAAGDMVSYGDDDGIWIAPSLIVAGAPAPGAEGSTWRRVDNNEIESWAHIGSTARIPRERLQPPTAGLSGERVSLRYGAQTVDLPLSQVGSDPDADRGGTMSAAQVRKLQDLVKTTPRGAWVGNQREYAVGDLVHRQFENHAITAYCLAAHSSTTANGPTPTGNATWATLLAVPRPDWDAADGTPAAIRNKPDVPGAISEHLLLFDDDGIHSGHGGNYWHRTNLDASTIPSGAEVAFEFPYTWSPTSRLWSHWPGAPTEVATEWWLRDVTQDGVTIDRIAAPDSSFVVGGDAHYHPFGYIDTAAAPRAMEIREIALIVDAAGYLVFCTRLDPPVVGDHPNAARATGIRMLWRS